MDTIVAIAIAAFAVMIIQIYSQMLKHSARADRAEHRLDIIYAIASVQGRTDIIDAIKSEDAA
ncbi:hypothetical protein P6144_00185 [Sphingomonas sp. HITSZ_GF]|uniref:hypothetical protein n=1 Tax=Sphingomonas sp. HITSZ_GF TaxID=3037247 RepID=UPI00240D32B7|nr:hypothetical protein [Sphingomonas sp. HITSZ_GF]MDG2532053.1 hypothetical protein [Sphingomonas sp. HITSZ_GF]